MASGASDRADEALLLSLIHSLTEYAIFVLDIDGNIRTWNPGAERLKGYAAEEIIGQHFSVFYEEPEREAGKPDWELAVAAAEGYYEDEGWRVRQDGSLFWANVVITAIRDEDGKLTGFGKVTRDLTERKRSEDAVRESEERFALLVSSVADYAIFLLRPDGTIASWNRGAERLKGYRADEIIGRHFSTFYVEEDRLAGLPAVGLATALEHGRWEHEGWRLRKDGTRFWADVVITALFGSDGTHRGFAKVTRDLTDRKRNEDALRGVLARERDAANRLRELDRLKTDFIAVVAHDLRAPVGVLQSVLQMASDEWDIAEESVKRDLVERARRRVDGLASFVDDVFDAARIETGELVVAREPIDLGALVVQVVSDFEIAAPGRPFVARGDDTAIAVGDRQRTWQVLVNLVSNAVKFSPSDATVTITVGRTDGEVVVEVADEGPGIPADQRPQLFRRFGRLPSAAATPGAGLGLFIAKSLAEAQGGSLEAVDPPAGTGATFVLSLPAAERGR